MNRIKTHLYRLLLCTFFVSFTAVSFAQITFSAKNQKIRQVIHLIEKNSNYSFFYNNDLPGLDKAITINAKNQSIDAVLKQVFQNAGISYKIDANKQIVLTASESKEENKEAQGSSTPGSHRISGVVIDSSTGETLPGVNIVIAGSRNGVITDNEGKFSIVVPSNSILDCSYVGYASKKMLTGKQGQMRIALDPDIKKLDEVVVIGYGTLKKADVTSSVATVKAENFIKGSVSDAGQLVQGKVAGLTVVMPTGDPTGSSQIVLRGNTTLVGASINPLVLIDGIPGDMKTVAPQDIESIDVLKDGSAAAIYGSRATNGVILITTRRADGNIKSSVEYSSYVSIQSIAKKLNLSTAADFRQQIKDGYRDTNSDLGSTTDWLSEISRQPVSHEHNLTFRGGNKTSNYLVNLNYNSAQGVFLKSYNEAFNGRADINHSMIDDKLKLNFGILNSTKKMNGFNGYIYRQALIQNPTAPVQNADGTWFQQLTKFEYENPVSDLKESDGLTSQHLSRFNGTITLTPIEGLKLSSVFSYSKWNQTNGYSETKQHASTLRDSKNGYANIGSAESQDKLAELTAEYSKSFGNHRIKGLIGYSYQENTYTNMYMENWDFPTDQFGYYNIGLGEANKNGKVTNAQSSYHSETNLIGFFGRLNYNYNDKYLLMASLRRESASQLWGTKDPWGTFPAVSLGWRLTKEPFMQKQTLFNDIKIRAGYGVTGTQPSDLFKGVGLVGYDQYILSNGKWVRTLIPTQNANPDLKWEEKKETDFGVDFSMFKNRVSGTIDYYIRNIDGLLFDYAVPSPPNLYSTTRANVGKMSNKGLEVLINYTPFQSKDFEWTTGVSFSTNTNKLVSLTNSIYTTSSDYFTTGYTGPPAQTFTHIVKVGEPLGNFYGFKVIDICNDKSDVANYGQWIYEGADGKPVKYSDFKHSFGDKKVLGNGLPKYYAGWTNRFRYKNWDLSITQRGAFKFQVANMSRLMYENPTYTQYNLLKSAFDKVYGKALLKSPQEFNSYYVENGDYWKIDNVTLGYNITNTGTKYIRSIRLYVSSLNTLIISGYKGIDPEVSLVTSGGGSQGGININSGAGLAPGVDQRDKYPTMRTFTFGLNVTF
jgi:TonB-linked SusC/RagA family outer membrane protein